MCQVSSVKKWAHLSYYRRQLAYLWYLIVRKMKSDEIDSSGTQRPPRKYKDLPAKNTSFYLFIQNGRPFKKIERIMNYTTFLTFLGSRNSIKKIFLRFEVKITFYGHFT